MTYLKVCSYINQNPTFWHITCLLDIFGRTNFIETIVTVIHKQGNLVLEFQHT